MNILFMINNYTYIAMDIGSLHFSFYVGESSVLSLASSGLGSFHGCLSALRNMHVTTPLMSSMPLVMKNAVRHADKLGFPSIIDPVIRGASIPTTAPMVLRIPKIVPEKLGARSIQEQGKEQYMAPPRPTARHSTVMLKVALQPTSAIPENAKPLAHRATADEILLTAVMEM